MGLHSLWRWPLSLVQPYKDKEQQKGKEDEEKEGKAEDALELNGNFS